MCVCEYHWEINIWWFQNVLSPLKLIFFLMPSKAMAPQPPVTFSFRFWEESRWCTKVLAPTRCRRSYASQYEK